MRTFILLCRVLDDCVFNVRVVFHSHVAVYCTSHGHGYLRFRMYGDDGTDSGGETAKCDVAGLRSGVLVAFGV